MFKCFVLWSKKKVFWLCLFCFILILNKLGGCRANFIGWWKWLAFISLFFPVFVAVWFGARFYFGGSDRKWFLFLSILTLGWVCEGGTVEERWQCRGSQECIVNTGRKILTHPRHSVDVCSLFFVSWCWTAQWKEPPDTESEVRVPPKKLLVLNSCCWPAKAPASVRRL